MAALAAEFEWVWRALGARQPHELAAMSLLDPARFRHPHYGRQGPATRLDNQGNWATARNPALSIPSHTCIEQYIVSYGSTRCTAAYCRQIA